MIYYTYRLRKGACDVGFLSFLTGYADDPIDQIAVSTGLSRLQVLQALDELEESGDITIKLTGVDKVGRKHLQGPDGHRRNVQ